MRSIPITKIDVKDSIKLVKKVLKSGLLTQGKYVESFENNFAKTIGVDHCVAVNNGTSALIAALAILDLKPDDEIITSPFSFIATLNSCLQTGAKVTFVDIEPDTFFLDIDQLKSKINSKTKVVLPVHLYGLTGDIEQVSKICEANQLQLVEDASQAHGATRNFKSLGTFGIGTFSFYGTKNITTGEGGMVATNDNGLAERLRYLRNQGMSEKYNYVLPGNNLRMTEIQAAIGISQLKQLKNFVNHRRRVANEYYLGLQYVKEIKLPNMNHFQEDSWHQYTIILLDQTQKDRENLKNYLQEKGVSTGIYYPRLMFDYKCFLENPKIELGDFPVAQSISNSCLSLPIYPTLANRQVHYIIDCIKDFYEKG